jgi:ankyrin repeat protein
VNIRWLTVCLIVLVQTSFASEQDLTKAIVDGDSDLVRQLIVESSDLNKTDRVVGAPLHYAATTGNSEIVQLLLDARADINLLTRFHPKKQAIHLAAANGHIQVLQILLDKGVDVNATSSRGSTALHEAVVGGSYDVARYLIEMGANTDITDDDKGFTPLHQAVRLNSPELASLLLDSGADPNARELKGETPLRLLLNATMIEKTSVYNALVSELLTRGAKIDDEDDDWAGMVGKVDEAQLIQLLKERIVR